MYEIKSRGLWCAAVTWDTTIGRRRKWLYGKTRKEVADKLTVALRARQQGLPQADDRRSVGAYLAEWLESTKGSVRPRTWERYEQYVRVHATPVIGRVVLSRLAPQHLQQLYANRIEAGLSESSVAHLHSVMHTALRQAEAWGAVQRNVARLVNPPRVRRHEMRTLSPAEARMLLQAASSDRYEALFAVAVSTGMRLGELLGLRWRDVQLDAATLRVIASLQATKEGYQFVEPKSARSRRQIALTQTAVAALRRHRAAQALERFRHGRVWHDLDLVFTSENGGPVDDTNLRTRHFYPLLARAGLPRLRLHDLRHTAATLMLGRGVHPKIASEMLGHSQIAVTLDLYSHVTPTMQRDAAATIDAVLSG